MNNRRQTPQEKKIKDYTHQRTNGYGRHDKSSRKAIRRRKRHVNSAFRSHQKNLTNNRRLDWDEIDVQLVGQQRPRWRKYADVLVLETLNWKWSGSSRTAQTPNRSESRKEACKRLNSSSMKLSWYWRTTLVYE